MPYDHAFAGALGALAMALSPFGMSASDCHDMADMHGDQDQPDESQQAKGCHAINCRRSLDGLLHKKS